MKGSLIDARFKGNILYSYGTQIISIGAGFLSVTIITRYAGIETYGMVSMMTALSGVLSNLLTFRTNEAVVKFYKRGRIENDQGLCRLALQMGMMLDLLVGVLLFLLVIGFSSTIAESLLKHPEMKGSVSIFAGVMLSTFLRGSPLGLLVALERFKFVNTLNVIEPLLKMILLVGIIAIGWKVTFVNIIWTMLLPSIAITALIYFLPVRELLGPLRRASFPRHLLSDYTRFSISTFVSSSLKAGNQHIDSMILGYLTNPVNVGLYNLFRQFLTPTVMLASPFSAQIYPRFVQAVTERKQEAIRETIKHANHLLLRGFIAMVAVIVPGLYLYGKFTDLHLTTMQYGTFVVMVINALLLQQLWWNRAFSLSVNPAWTVQANVIATIFMLTCVTFGVVTLGFPGVALGSSVVLLVLHIFWRSRLGVAI